MKEELLKKIPEINQITNKEIRDKTIAVFIEALEEGGWKVADLDRIPFTLLIADNPISLLTHIRAVTASALKVAEVFDDYYKDHFKIDRDILLSGAILHDVGKLLECEETPKGFRKHLGGKMMRHPFSGAGLALKHFKRLCKFNYSEIRDKCKHF